MAWGAQQGTGCALWQDVHCEGGHQSQCIVQIPGKAWNYKPQINLEDPKIVALIEDKSERGWGKSDMFPLWDHWHGFLISEETEQTVLCKLLPHPGSCCLPPCATRSAPVPGFMSALLMLHICGCWRKQWYMTKQAREVNWLDSEMRGNTGFTRSFRQSLICILRDIDEDVISAEQEGVVDLLCINLVLSPRVKLWAIGFVYVLPSSCFILQLNICIFIIYAIIYNIYLINVLFAFLGNLSPRY